MGPTVVLLVDDEAPFVETLTRRLARKGFVILKAFSGLEALDGLSRRRDVDVVLLDVKMPGMDGIETLRAIKRHHPLVEVILLTGHAVLETAIEGMKLGAFDFLLKPCEMEHLVGKILDAKDRRRDRAGKVLQARAVEAADRRGD
ncbi:MAG TPA: response regulator [Syntrophobacteraceae bacterium]|nr:response regulator [Syntrophobacteraceae bacterium]